MARADGSSPSSLTSPPRAASSSTSNSPRDRGSALQLNVHFHVVVPEGLFDSQGHFSALPPPDDADVESLLETFLRRLKSLLERRGLLELEAIPEDALDALRLESTQRRLPLGVEPRRLSRRCAFLDGFSLHANTRVHENDRHGLETLCRYGARGALSLERLTRREDGTLLYRMKRPAPDGATHLVLTPLQLLRKLAALIPPPRFNLTRFHGVFAPNSKLRPRVVPTPTTSPVGPVSAPRPSGASVASAPDEEPPRRADCLRYRVPWAELLRRSFAADVLVCNLCGAHRRVLAFISHLPTARRILEHLQLPQGPPPLPLPAASERSIELLDFS